MTRNYTPRSERGKAYMTMESDSEYRQRLIASGRLSGLEMSMARDYHGVYLDGIGDALKPEPIQRRLKWEGL